MSSPTGNAGSVSSPAASDGTRIKRPTISDYALLRLCNPEPFDIWSPNHNFNDSRVSDFVACMCVVEAYRNKNPTSYSAMAINYFNKNNHQLRTYGNLLGHGMPLIYENKFVCFGDYVMRGNCDLQLGFGPDIRLLCRLDPAFVEWIGRVSNGDYASFTFDILSRHPDILRSLTSPRIPGSIGSSNPLEPGPFFSVPPGVFSGHEMPIDAPVPSERSEPPAEETRPNEPINSAVMNVEAIRAMPEHITTNCIVIRAITTQVCADALKASDDGDPILGMRMLDVTVDTFVPAILDASSKIALRLEPPSE